MIWICLTHDRLGLDVGTEDGIPFTSSFGSGSRQSVDNVEALLERLQAIVVIPTKRDGRG